MKKYIIFIISILFIPINIYALDINKSVNYVLMDYDSGVVLDSNNMDEKKSVASLTKMALQVIILEDIEKGKHSFKDKVIVSENAANMGGSQIYLAKGEVMSIYDLFRGLTMASANDSAVALAEEFAGSEDEMVKRMNRLAKRLNLKNTSFKNVTGLDQEGHYSSAYDLSIIAKELIKHKKIFHFTTMYEGYLRENTPNKFWLVNTNKLIKRYNGVDGLKTGHTDNSKYTSTITAKRNDLRLIVTVLNEEDIASRNNDTIKLLDYGFNNYKSKVIKRSNKPIKKIKLNHSNRNYLNIYLKEDIKVLNKRSDNNKYKVKYYIDKYKFPLKKNSNIGYYDLIYDKKVIKKDYLICKDNIYKLSILDIFINNIMRTINGKI